MNKITLLMAFALIINSTTTLTGSKSEVIKFKADDVENMLTNMTPANEINEVETREQIVEDVIDTGLLKKENEVAKTKAESLLSGGKTPKDNDEGLNISGIAFTAFVALSMI